MLAAATPVAAQSVASVKIGQNVSITSAQGFEFRGDVTAICSAAVEVVTAAGPKRLAMDQVWMISKKDSNTNGFWIGFAIGTLPIISLADGHWSGGALSFAAMGGLLYGGVGMLIDNAIEGRQLLYHRPERDSAAVVNIGPIVGLDNQKRVGLGGTIIWK